MPAYVLSEVDVLDAAAADRYRTLAAASIAMYNGRYLARGAVADVAEGAPARGRFVIVEFPSMSRAREWYASSEYAEALAIRQTALERRLVFVEGVGAPSEDAR